MSHGYCTVPCWMGVCLRRLLFGSFVILFFQTTQIYKYFFSPIQFHLPLFHSLPFIPSILFFTFPIQNFPTKFSICFINPHHRFSFPLVPSPSPPLLLPSLPRANAFVQFAFAIFIITYLRPKFFPSYHRLQSNPLQSRHHRIFNTEYPSQWNT